MPRFDGRLAVAALALGAAACSTLAPTFRPRVGVGGRSGSPGTSGGLTPPVTSVDPAGGRASGRDSLGVGRPRDRVQRLPNDRGQLDVRRVCRNASFPRGYIATAYESSASQCPLSPGRADSVGTVAVLVRYDAAPVGTRLDMCADQVIPSGWSPARDEGPGDPGACPGATRNGDTVQRIVRTY